MLHHCHAALPLMLHASLMLHVFATIIYHFVIVMLLCYCHAPLPLMLLYHCGTALPLMVQYHIHCGTALPLMLDGCQSNAYLPLSSDTVMHTALPLSCYTLPLLYAATCMPFMLICHFPTALPFMVHASLVLFCHYITTWHCHPTALLSYKFEVVMLLCCSCATSQCHVTLPLSFCFAARAAALLVILLLGLS